MISFAPCRPGWPPSPSYCRRLSAEGQVQRALAVEGCGGDGREHGDGGPRGGGAFAQARDGVLEVGPDEVEVFVRDHGDGFDVDAIGPDRFGVRESIMGRVHRRGGTATVTSRPDRGTEVHLLLPVGGAAAPAPVARPVTYGGGRDATTEVAR